MPWRIYDPKRLTKAESRKLFCMTERMTLDYPALREATAFTAKPDTVPEGMALRFFPTSDDIYYSRDRINNRIYRGTDKLPPWEDENFLLDSARPHWSTVRHITDLYMPTLTPDGQLAYYPTFTAQKEDRRSMTTIGRFLNLVWTNLDEPFDGWMTNNYGPLTDAVVRAWSEVPKALTPDDIKFATTEDEIEYVYDHGPTSCMAGKPKEIWKATGVHPARAYAGGDLAVAWLPKRRDPNTASQRVLCWPAKKIYSRIYGSGPLETFLKQLGYVHGTFHGAKLKKIETNERIVLPYIDYHDSVVERRDHLRIWHKQESHPWAPDVKINIKPRTQRAVWSAAGTTAGYVTKHKCRHCACTVRQMDVDYTGDWGICRKCYKHVTTCRHCQRFSAQRSDTRWTWVMAKDDLMWIHTLDDIIAKKRSVMSLCPTCAAHATVRRDYYRAGYIWVSAETKQPVDLRT